MSFCRAFTAVGLPIMGGNSTPEELFNLSDLRVELLQSIDSLAAAHGEQKLGSSLKLGYELCEGAEDVDRQL